MLQFGGVISTISVLLPFSWSLLVVIHDFRSDNYAVLCGFNHCWYFYPISWKLQLDVVRKASMLHGVFFGDVRHWCGVENEMYMTQRGLLRETELKH